MEKEKEAKKQFKPYYRRKDENGSSQPPTHSPSVMNLTEVRMDNFCTFHQQPHSEKSYPQWINSMTLVMNQLIYSKLTEPVAEEEKIHELEETPEETTMVLWDCAPMLGLEEEEPNEEIQLSDVNVTTRSKGLIIEDNTLLPKIKTIQENLKKVRNNS